MAKIAAMTPRLPLRTIRLQATDAPLARQLFLLLAEIFENDAIPLSTPYLQRLLGRADFWAIAAFAGDRLAGGLTAFTLPRITSEASEIFLYDIAVHPDLQRQGIGRLLVAHLRQAASEEGIDTLWVPADNEDQHALDFYRALGGSAAPVTIFTL
jgi:aminoglycoside 3-N-acetyltransferase I